MAGNKEMNAEDVLLSLEKMLEVWKVPSGDIAVSYQNCEEKDGMFLRSNYGTGKTFQEACKNYLNQLHGNTDCPNWAKCFAC